MLAAASPLLKSLLLQSPETDTLYLDTSFDVLKKLIKFVYDVDPIVTPRLPKREALENKRHFKEWLNLLRVPFVAEKMDAVEPDSIRPIIDCHFCKHKICTHSSNEDYLGHLR